MDNAASALDLLSVGLLRRTSAATHSNGHSSRSHAVFTIHCTTARMLEDGSPRETTAKLHLVDLAGRFVVITQLRTMATLYSFISITIYIKTQLVLFLVSVSVQTGI